MKFLIHGFRNAFIKLLRLSSCVQLPFIFGPRRSCSVPLAWPPRAEDSVIAITRTQEELTARFVRRREEEQRRQQHAQHYELRGLQRIPASQTLSGKMMAFVSGLRGDAQVVQPGLLSHGDAKAYATQ
jgi:hypothetical protein